ncbi:MAG: hypothetical protein JOZ85_06975 [Betaproteobacteria bacterium]|nr:hypothetical protein [Betaproteobacteria bacterium]
MVVAACQSAVVPAPGKLRPWTIATRDAEPAEARAAVYTLRGRRLIFIAARHENRTDSPTFRLIDEAYALFHVDALLLEGPPHSRGPDYERLLKWAEAERDVNGFVEGGEAVPAIRGAVAQRAKVWGGEPDDTDIRDRVLARGFSAQDLVGFYTLRSVPQWIRERKIDGAGDPRVEPLVTAELARSRARLAVSETVLPGYDAWLEWYAQANHKAFGVAFDPEETGPLADGGYRSHQIAEAISRARDEFLLDITARHLNAGESVMVVFGASHFTIVQPALDAMLGQPCYVGSELKSAAAQCAPAGTSPAR